MVNNKFVQFLMFIEVFVCVFAAIERAFNNKSLHM